MNLFRSCFRRIRNRRRHQSIDRAAAVRVEELEDRTLLAGDVQVLLSGRDVALFGDAGDNEIAIEQFNNWIIVRGLNGTTINGMNEYLLSGLPYLQDDMLIQLGDGNDVVFFADGVQVGDDLRIDTGNGNDIVRLSNNRILDDLIIDTGAGDDTIIVSNTDVMDDWAIQGGSGNNIVSVVDTRVVDDFVLQTGNENDTVTLLGNTAGDRNEVHTHGGNDLTDVQPVNDGRMLPGADILGQFTNPTANDDVYDVVGGTLSVDAMNGVAVNDMRSTIGGSTTISLESNITNGNVTVNADGSFSVEFTPDFVGTDSFTYRLSNSFGGFSIGTVTLTTFEIDDSANPVAQSNGITVTTQQDFILHGKASAGATIAIDRDGDGMFDDGTVGADANGNFMVTLPLVHDDTNNGVNMLQIRSTTPNGRSTTMAYSVHYATGTVIRFDTDFGSFDVELFDDAMPITVENFKKYLDEFENSIAHSLTEGTLQGGRFQIDASAAASLFGFPVEDPIANEFNAAHTNMRGTLSVVLPDGDPDGATATWSINLENNTDLDDAMTSVFGRVIGTGMEDVVDQIAGLSTHNLGGVVPDTNLPDVPLVGYTEFEDQLDGTVSIEADTNVVTGVATAFLADLVPTVNGVPGSVVQIGEVVYVVGEITSNTSMTLLNPDLTDANVETAVEDGTVFINRDPAPNEYVVFEHIKDLFNSVAVTDEYETFDDAVLDATVSVLDNDLFAETSAETTVSLSEDPDDQPMHGEVVLNADGTFTYTPDGMGFVGIDTFKYVLTNTLGFTTTGLVRINTMDFDVTATADPTDMRIVESNGLFVTESTTIKLVGDTEAGAIIEVDTDGDGEYDDGTAVADGSGEFTVDIMLHEHAAGEIEVAVRSRLPMTGFVRETTVDVHFAVGTVINFETSVGSWLVELLDDDAPVTVENFLSYLEPIEDENDPNDSPMLQYMNSIVHRSAKFSTGRDFVVQGGGFRYDATEGSVVDAVVTLDPITNEFNAKNSNERSTLSTALGGGPNTATSQWFFNLVNNNVNDPAVPDDVDLDAAMHVVFGRVIGGEAGMTVLDAIADAEVFNLNGILDANNDGILNDRAFGTTPLAGFTPFQAQISGTVSVTAGTSIVTGTNTSFESELIGSTFDGFGNLATAGTSVMIDGEEFYVNQVISDTQFTIIGTTPTSSSTHSAGATDADVMIHSVPLEENFIVFENIDRLFDDMNP